MAQKDGYTITAETQEMSFEEAKQAAIHLISREKDLRPFVLLPIATKERWDSCAINFCPRCGTNLKNNDLESLGEIKCPSCNAYAQITITSVDEADC